MTDNEEIKKHSLNLENRERLDMDGIIDVEAFNEEEITAKSSLGNITVRGGGLHIEVLGLESGTLTLSGKIDAVIYSASRDKKGLFKRAFLQ